jgi:hypothetical protein
VEIIRQGNRWAARDSANDTLPFPPNFQDGWQFLARSGGHPALLAGEWDGKYLLPLNFWPDDRLIT